MKRSQLVQPPKISRPSRRSLLKAIAIFRGISAAGFAIVFFFEVLLRNIRDDFEPEVARPEAGLVLVCLGILTTAALGIVYRRNWQRLTEPKFVLSELFVAVLMLSAGPWVFGFTDHLQSLPSVWLIASVATVAISAGTRAAIATGAGFGLIRYVSWLPYSTGPLVFTPLTTIVQLAVAGGVFGYILTKLADAERSISGFRAREEVARTLHDGVLQTLAIIQRRGNEPDLVDLARTQELELRDYLFGNSGISETKTDLAASIREVGKAADQRHKLKVNVVTAPDLPKATPEIVHAVTGAVTECISNASKHGTAATVNVYAEPDSSDSRRFFVSVKDDGQGFDEDGHVEGQGLTQSIRARVIEAGGKVEVSGNPGRGTEVKMWI